MTMMPAVSDNPLANLDERIRAHWEKYLPHMSAALKAQGKFDECVAAAVQLTEDAVFHYRGDGLDAQQSLLQAWEMFREEWAFLPAEEEGGDSSEQINPLDFLVVIQPDEDEEARLDIVGEKPKEGDDEEVEK